MNYKKKISEIKSEAKRAKLVIVTKNQQINNIQTIYNLGERHFGENRVQELLNKHKQLPKDIKCFLEQTKDVSSLNSLNAVSDGSSPSSTNPAGACIIN